MKTGSRSGVDYFKLFTWGLEISVRFAPVTFLLGLWVVVAYFALTFRRREILASDVLIAFLPLAGTLLIPALGSLLACKKGNASNWLIVVLALQGVASAVFLVRGRFRWLLGGVFAFELWMSLCMAFIAGISIADDWL